MRPAKFKRVLVVILALALIFGAWFGYYAFHHRLSLAQNPFFARMIPLYRSLRKLPDILFFPYHFRTTKLESFELSIQNKDINTLNSHLPANPFGEANTLDEESKVEVKGFFKASDYAGEVKIRYRGNAANHWNSYKKSYLLEFPSDNLFRGQKYLNLVIPSDRKYFSESLNNYRAKKLGLMYAEDSYARVYLNGVDMGPYLIFEKWSQEWLEKHPISSLSIILGIDDKAVPVPSGEKRSVFSEEGLPFWRSWNTTPEDASEIGQILIWLASYSSEKDFPKYADAILDLDSFYAEDIISVLSGGFHNSSNDFDANNIILVFDGTTGKIKAVPYNTTFYYGERFISAPTTLWERIVNVPEFKARRDQMFDDYVKNQKADDLNYLKNFLAKMKPEFLSDDAKDVNDFTLLKILTSQEKATKDYFDDPFNKLQDQYKGFSITAGHEKFPDNKKYDHLTEAVDSVKTFVSKNPQFYLDYEGLHLFSGVHIFEKDVIVPYGTSLTIDPGAVLLFDKNVSIISYSPVKAIGREFSKIKFGSLNYNENWGVFAVINTQDNKSEFKYTEFSGGGEDQINGVYFSGMLALHDADAKISHSSFSSNIGDDALNVKHGTVQVVQNTFTNTFQDGVDSDFIDDKSEITANTFVNVGGDAIDLSWTNIKISDNVVSSCKDKGVSVGEKSNPEISNNIFAGCDLGVAVKDSSVAKIHDNQFIKNRIALTAYRKKEIFGGGVYDFKNNLLWQNHKDQEIDSYSSGVYKDNQEKTPEIPQVFLPLFKKFL